MSLSFRGKLIEVYKKIDHIEKKGNNARQGYRFVRSADVLRAIRNAFAELGIYAQTNVDLLSTYDIKTNSGGNMHAATVKVTITLHDLDSSETLIISGIGDGADSGDKGVYKAQTGGVKNALRNAFLVPDEADPEADETVDEQVEEVQPTAPLPVRPKRVVSEAPAIDRGSKPNAPEPPPMVEEIPVPMPVPQQAVGITGGILPDKDALEKYRVAIVNLQKELADYGGLKPSRGLTVSRKILLYLLKTAGVASANEITVQQWDTIFGFFNKTKESEGGIANLAKLIDAAAKSKG